MKQDYKNLNLSRLRACNQYWDEMMPAEQGRICSKCSNVIHDFRDKSLFEIAKTHANSEEKVCGLYSREQLKKGKVKKAKQINSWWKSALLAVSSFLNTEEVLATENPKNVKIELSKFNNSQLGRQIHHRKVFKNPVADSVVFYGNIKVAEGKDSVSVPGINVMVKGKDIGVVSDSYGNYRLDLSDRKLVGDSITLIFSYIGYATKEVPLEVTNRKNLDVVLTPLENQIIEFYVIEKQPLHRRVWFWLTSPFRK